MAAEKRSLSDPDEVITITMPPATIARTTAKTGLAIDTLVRRIHARKFDPGVCSLDSLCCEVGTAISTSSYCPISSRATKGITHKRQVQEDETTFSRRGGVVLSRGGFLS